MKKYLLKITPLEPYTFGGENGFAFEEAGVKGTYFMESKKIPEQTTIIGMIRFLMLQSEGKLKSSFDYSEEEKAEIVKVCGPDTFMFEPENEQDFGLIKKISPVFIIDKDNNIYIKNPFCFINTEESYRVLKMSKTVECSLGTQIKLPADGETGYQAKQGYGRGYLCIDSKNAEKGRIKEDSEFFESQMIAGNRKSDESEEDGFFRREVVTMKNASFGVYLTVDDSAQDILRQTIVYMGKKKSAFKVQAERISEDTALEEQVCRFFDELQLEDTWLYCLSDIFSEDQISYDSFAITETKCIRNLKTSYSKRGITRKGQKRYHLISNGSVFYEKIPEGLWKDEKNLKKVGYNCIVKMGGR